MARCPGEVQPPALSADDLDIGFAELFTWKPHMKHLTIAADVLLLIE
jgi:hypothetical protein